MKKDKKVPTEREINKLLKKYRELNNIPEGVGCDLDLGDLFEDGCNYSVYPWKGKVYVVEDGCVDFPLQGNFNDKQQEIILEKVKKVIKEWKNKE